MTSFWLENLASYSLQIALLLAAGGLALQAFRLRPPVWRLLCWQFLLAVCLLLPFAESWRSTTGHASILITTGDFTPAVHGPSRAWSNVPWIQTLAILLVSGVAVRLGLFALGLVRLSAYRRRSLPQPDLASTPNRLGIRAEIRASDEIPGPVTFGLFRPVILVPSRWLSSEPVLYHELIHVRRRDWLFMSIEELIRAVLWFHPLVWWAIAQIQLAREEVVDREVIQITSSREQYLETLLAIAAARSGLDLAPAPLFLRKRHLRSRVASLMKEVKMSRIRLHCSLAGFLALTLAAGWMAVRSFPLQAAQESSNADAKGRPVTLQVKTSQGEVGIVVQLDRDGKVLGDFAISGPNDQRQTVLNAARTWHYTVLGSAEVKVDSGTDSRFTVRVANQVPKRIRVGGNVQATNIIKKVTPTYPEAAKAARIQGLVRLNVTISAQGKVEDVQVEEGDPQLTDAAVAAVRQWEYRPTLLNGEPIAVVTTVDVNFTLSQ